jgi:histidyl-tRNA synthetase
MQKWSILAPMKPSLPKGTRDFAPDMVLRRNYIFGVLRGVFERYGFQPLETPVMENLSTLTGKYGEEGDQLLFKILNSGDFLAKATNKEHYQKLTFEICEKGLRYDLTVPFARYVVMNRNDITLPFKRYQMQPVWRADRPQKGRYREFYQCDVDVVGSTSLLNEVELLRIYDEAFAELGLRVVIKVNNRKLLAALAEVADIPTRLGEMTVAIDKLDKIGWDGVEQEMVARGISASVPALLREALAMPLEALDGLLGRTEVGKLGMDELRQVFDFLAIAPLVNRVEFDLTLARGLSYYTGTIVEVVVDTTAAGQEAVRMGSIGGGGRYDDLTGIFGMKGLSGVGVSFGFDRIYDVLVELGRFPADAVATITQVLFVAMDAPSRLYAYQCLLTARKAGVYAQIYPDVDKIAKQMKYADAMGIPFVAICGETERLANTVMLKNMTTGEQQLVDVTALVGIVGTTANRVG